MAQNTISWGWWRQVNTPIWEFILRVPAPDGSEFISDLRTIFASSPKAVEDQGETADTSMIGVEDAETDHDHGVNPEEHSAVGAG
jgi:hypothetical protein